MNPAVLACFSGVAAIHASAPAGHTYGSDVWPAASGLTLSHMSASTDGHTLTGDGSGVTASALITSPPTISAGDVWAYSISNDGLSGDNWVLNIGGTGAAFTVSLTSGATTTGTFTVPASPAQTVRVRNLSNSQDRDGNAETAAVIYIKKQLT